MPNVCGAKTAQNCRFPIELFGKYFYTLMINIENVNDFISSKLAKESLLLIYIIAWNEI